MGRRWRPPGRNGTGRLTGPADTPSDHAVPCAATGLPSPDAFDTLVAWRRDVRRFRTDPIDEGVLTGLLETANRAPSVGNSQPWRIVDVARPDLRAAMRANFEAANAAAAAGYDGDQQEAYRRLKLAGFDQAPVHLAVFCNPDPGAGHGLGRQTQPETLAYSCAGMITVLWLAARTRGIGLGWVSIIDPTGINGLLQVPADWRLIGYLLLGHPEEEHLDPELERHGWQAREPLGDKLIRR